MKYLPIVLLFLASCSLFREEGHEWDRKYDAMLIQPDSAAKTGNTYVEVVDYNGYIFIYPVQYLKEVVSLTGEGWRQYNSISDSLQALDNDGFVVYQFPEYFKKEVSVYLDRLDYGIGMLIKDKKSGEYLPKITIHDKGFVKGPLYGGGVFRLIVDGNIIYESSWVS